MDITVLLTSLLTIVTVYVITEQQRRLIESKIEAIQLDVISYHNRLIDEITDLQGMLQIATSDNIDQL
jgi:hypothetical protein